MANPRIEEVEDDDDDFSDPEEMDLDAFDFARPKGTLGQSPDGESSSQDAALQDLLQKHTQPSNMPTRTPAAPQLTRQDHERKQREQMERSKHFQCIYPVYFDATRSREQGRRVSKSAAVTNPLAREIVDALQAIGNDLDVPFHVVFEPAKMHPKDWANPGRVRVLIKKAGEDTHSKIRGKHHLYKLIAEHLQAHPTTEESPLRLRVQGLPMPKDKIPPPAVPRGFKIGNILPLHSPALSGGGVSDNMLKDMMGEMGGQLPPGMEGMAGLMNAMGGGGGGASGGGGGGGGSQKKVKEKKKK